MRMVLRLLLAFLVLVVFLWSISFIRHSSLLETQLFQELVKLRKFLSTAVFPIRLDDPKYFLSSAIYQYKDTFSSGETVNVFQGRFSSMDLDNQILWLIGDNLVRYGFYVKSESLIFVNIRDTVPEETNPSSYSLANGWLREGEFIKVFWNDQKTVKEIVKDWEMQDDVVNQNSRPVHRIEKYENK